MLELRRVNRYGNVVTSIHSLVLLLLYVHCISLSMYDFSEISQVPSMTLRKCLFLMYSITHNAIATYYFLFTYDSNSCRKTCKYIIIRDMAYIQVNTGCIQLLYGNTSDSRENTT